MYLRRLDLVGFKSFATRVTTELQPGIVVNDRLGLNGETLERAGLQLESRTLRHVNRRTGRRAGEYFEEILVARAS